MSSGWVMSAKVSLASSDGLYPVSLQKAAFVSVRRKSSPTSAIATGLSTNTRWKRSRASLSEASRSALALRRGSRPPPWAVGRPERDSAGNSPSPRSAGSPTFDPGRRSRSQGREKSSSTSRPTSSSRGSRNRSSMRALTADPVLAVHEQHRVRRELEQGFVLGGLRLQARQSRLRVCPASSRCSHSSHRDWRCSSSSCSATCWTGRSTAGCCRCSGSSCCRGRRSPTR